METGFEFLDVHAIAQRDAFGAHDTNQLTFVSPMSKELRGSGGPDVEQLESGVAPGFPDISLARSVRLVKIIVRYA